MESDYLLYSLLSGCIMALFFVKTSTTELSLGAHSQKTFHVTKQSRKLHFDFT